jgi:hypothetical protein
MNGSARFLIAGAIVLLGAGAAAAQVNYRPTAPPVVTAENEAWYLAGDPVMYGGNVYYPAGPQVHFNSFEMIRSGFFEGVPLYTRTTIEPFSLVFVPLPGGLMQPYERRRDGDVAGTVGSSVPSFPVVRSSEATGDLPMQGSGAVGTAAIILAPEPGVGTMDPGVSPPARDVAPLAAMSKVVSMAGRTGGTYTSRAEGGKPGRLAGVNAVFIEFEGRRYFSDGAATRFDSAKMRRIGEHHGFAVYAESGRDPAAIYVPVSSTSNEFVARYSRQRPR